MSKLSFVLRKNKAGIAGISLKHTHQQHLDLVPFVRATGVAVPPEKFDLTMGKVVGLSNAPELNAQIQRHVHELETALRNLTQRGVEPFKKNLDKELAWIAEINKSAEGEEQPESPVPTSLVRLQAQLAKAEKRVLAIKKLIEQKEIELGIFVSKLFTTHVDEFIKSSSATLKKNSLKNYTGLKQAVDEWNPTFNITDIDPKSLAEFRDFLLTKKKLRTRNETGETQYGLRNSSVRELIQKMKIVYYAFSDKFGYDVTKVKKWKHNVKKLQNHNVVYLTSAELAAVVSMPCRTEREHIHRDFYVFMCQTGLRFVDARSVTRTLIQQNTIHIIQQKTTKKVVIPLTQLALDILERWHYDFSSIRYTAQIGYYMNVLLKRNELLPYPASRTHYKQNTGKEEVRPKRELILAHTARKTFINISLQNGMKITSIKNIVGHSELQMIMGVYGDGNLDRQEMAKVFIMPEPII